MNQNQEIIR